MEKLIACDRGDYSDYDGDCVVLLNQYQGRRVAVVFSDSDAAGIVAAANSHEEMLTALRYVATRCVSEAAYPHASIEDRKMRDMVVAALSKAEGGAS